METREKSDKIFIEYSMMTHDLHISSQKPSTSSKSTIRTGWFLTNSWLYLNTEILQRGWESLMKYTYYVKDDPPCPQSWTLIVLFVLKIGRFLTNFISASKLKSGKECLYWHIMRIPYSDFDLQNLSTPLKARQKVPQSTPK